MSLNNFNQRKKEILSKDDKSSIGGWDKHIKSLCDKINKMSDCYTTSSCSGRSILIVDQEKKAQGLFKAVSHEPITFKWLKENLEELSKKNKGLLKFKTEPCILHIACEDLEIAKKLINLARPIGWKRSGIITIGKNIIVELNSTEKLEFPILEGDRILVDDYFLKLIAKQANEKLKRSWKKIKELEKALSKL